jgi:NADP-dependent 3-hydroxy acid dehydrogenase YdfG
VLLGQDVQNILLRTAAKNDEGDIDWVVNGAGLHVNHKVNRQNSFPWHDLAND